MSIDPKDEVPSARTILAALPGLLRMRDVGLVNLQGFGGKRTLASYLRTYREMVTAKATRGRESDSGTLPDFAIAGAPKCGTTSLYDMLSTHPEICMSYIKQPHFFATDLPGLREVTDKALYIRLFKPENKDQRRGEASPLYLFSSDAITKLSEANPKIRIVALVRNPVDLFQSFHGEMLKTLEEDQRDPEIAWGLQEERRAGSRLPAQCREPALLQYKRVCLLGEQIQRLFRVVPREQCCICLFEEFTADPRACVARILTFLGVSDVTSPAPQMSNEHKEPRTAVLAKLILFFYRNPRVNRIRVVLKPKLGKLGIRPVHWLIKLNLKKSPKAKLSPEFKASLTKEFHEDISLLERLIGQSLQHWEDPTSAKRVTRFGTPEAGNLRKQTQEQTGIRQINA